MSCPAIHTCSCGQLGSKNGAILLQSLAMQEELAGGSQWLEACPSDVSLPSPLLDSVSWLPRGERPPPSLRPTTMEPTSHESNPLGQWAQINHSSFKLFLLFFSLFYVDRCFVCMYVCTTCIQCLRRQEEGFRSSGTRITEDGCE